MTLKRNLALMAAALLLPWSIASCFLPEGEGVGRVSVVMDLSQALYGEGSAGGGEGLGGDAAVLMVRVDGADLMEPVRKYWWLSGENPSLPAGNMVELEFDVPAGTNRSFSAVAFLELKMLGLRTTEEVETFATTIPTVADVLEGVYNEVDLYLERSPTGAVIGRVTAPIEYDLTGSKLFFVDVDTCPYYPDFTGCVFFPPVALDGGVNGSTPWTTTYLYPYIPVLRTFNVQVMVQGASGAIVIDRPDIDIYLSHEGEIGTVDIDLTADLP